MRRTFVAGLLLLSLFGGVARAEIDYCLHVPEDPSCFQFEEHPSAIQLEFNGRAYVYYPSEVRPVEDANTGRILIPLRIMQEIPGTKWTVTNDGKWIWFRTTDTHSAARLIVGTTYAMDPNGILEYRLDVAPRRIGYSLYVPARAAADLINCYSEWQWWRNTFAIDCRKPAENVENIASLMEEQPPRYEYKRNQFEVPFNEHTMAYEMYPSTFKAYHWNLQAQNAIVWSLPKQRNAKPLTMKTRNNLVWAEDDEGRAVYRLSGAIGLRVMDLWEAEQFRLALSSQTKRNTTVLGLTGVALGLLFPGAKETLLMRTAAMGIAGASAGYATAGIRADTVGSCIGEAKGRYKGREAEAFIMVAWRGVWEVTCIPEYINRDLTWEEIKTLEVQDTPWW